VATLRDGLALAERGTDAGLELMLSYHLGRALHETGHDDEALISLRRALDIAIDARVYPGFIGDIAVYIGHILLLRPRNHAGERRHDRI
jgi:hypothetical protein